MELKFAFLLTSLCERHAPVKLTKDTMSRALYALFGFPTSCFLVAPQETKVLFREFMRVRLEEQKPRPCLLWE